MRYVFAGMVLAAAVSAAEEEQASAVDEIPDSANATIIDDEGTPIGTGSLTQTPQGVLIKAKVSGLTPGMHGFHLHAKGECEVPDFESAGDHLDFDGEDHGLLLPSGSHAGDLPNQYVGSEGRLVAEVLNTRISLAQLRSHADGVTLVIHSAADDYRSQPGGAAGSRVACGVVRLAKE